ncbi:MAG TPA: lactate utilization protein, partial [Rubrivivax sp.]|nr:lactate utilization protein [Rubrivivax sp.]
DLQQDLDAALQGIAVRRFEAPLQSWKHALFAEMPAAVTSSVAGVADTGTLVLWPGPDEPRTLSLIPPLHIAVLRASRLYASLPAAVAALQPQARMPSNLLLVSGPSKTADIQQVLAYGAHGPKELVIVLVNDRMPGMGEQP